MDFEPAMVRIRVVASHAPDAHARAGFRHRLRIAVEQLADDERARVVRIGEAEAAILFLEVALDRRDDALHDDVRVGVLRHAAKRDRTKFREVEQPAPRRGGVRVEQREDEEERRGDGVVGGEAADDVWSAATPVAALARRRKSGDWRRRTPDERRCFKGPHVFEERFGVAQTHEARAAFAAAEQMPLDARDDFRRRGAVEVQREEAGQSKSETRHFHLLTTGRRIFSSMASARASRDETVPIEQPSTSAIWSYGISST